MLRLLVGLVFGFGFGYLYGSERARAEAQRRVSAMPEPVRRTTEGMARAIENAPVPDAVKQTTQRAAAAVQTAVDRAAAQVSPSLVAIPTAAEIAGRPDDPLPRMEPESVS